MLRLTVFGQTHGLANGIIRPSTTPKKRAAYEPGNIVHVTWKGRLADQLGSFTLEPISSSVALLMHDPLALLALASATALTAATIPESHPEAELYNHLQQLLTCLADDGWYGEYIRFELALLAVCGYPLDLSRCVATGAKDNLVYVSPKSGRAVSQQAGAPYAERMLPLPPCARSGVECASLAELLQGLRLTGYFLEHTAMEILHRPLPPVRARFIAAVQRASSRIQEESL